MSTPDPSMPDPYQDYDPERARHQGMWFIATLVALVIVSGLIYGAAHRGEKVASNIPAGSIEAPKDAPSPSTPSTTGSAPSSR